ncbi:MAG: 2-hydroxyacyl-CoA dehydratase [Deltaproteobacteria bacterium]|nr:2-hydroxyacyl-CoA dehydratase [Deltaproteobacteria bacterium]
MPEPALGCAYTPLPLVAAAGFRAVRVLPVTEAPERAGSLLHDNLCPHVKRVVDRALAGDLPDLAGVVIVPACDAMRRLGDAWYAARPSDRIATFDLPASGGEGAADRLEGSLARLRDVLAGWSGRPIADEAIRDAARAYDALADALAGLGALAAAGRLPGGRARLQEAFAASVTLRQAEAVAALRAMADDALPGDAGGPRGVPLFVFGNVLPLPEAFRLIEDCGGHVVDDDLCTGSRQIAPLRLADGEDPLRGMARSLLSRPPCARTIPSGSRSIANLIVDRARACGARGVVAHVAKFCDPYLARIPAIRKGLVSAGLPLLVLEGDCTQRSLGQQRTRIEAFVEMLGGEP